MPEAELFTTLSQWLLEWAAWEAMEAGSQLVLLRQPRLRRSGRGHPEARKRAQGEGPERLRLPVGTRALWSILTNTALAWTARLWDVLTAESHRKGKRQSRSSVRLSATPWTVAHQAPLSMGFQARMLE